MLTLLLGGLPALISFLGGATARALIGHVIKWFEQKQTHMQEQESLRLQDELAQNAHVRQLDLIKQQSDLKLGEIKLVGENAIGIAEAQAFVEAQKVANTPTGNKFVDAWNGTIRPAVASVAIIIWLMKIIKAGLTVTAWDENLVASVFGYYFADRQLGKRNR